MPDWLRRALIATMKPAHAKQVRSALNRMLAAAQSTNNMARDEAILIRIGQDQIKERHLPHELFDDEVLIDFLARGRVEDFELPFSNVFRRLLPEDISCRFGLPELAAITIAAAYAITAFLVAPKPADGALVTGAWLALLELPVGAFAVWALIAAVTGPIGRRAADFARMVQRWLKSTPTSADHPSPARLRWIIGLITLLAFLPIAGAALLARNVADGQLILQNLSDTAEAPVFATTPNGKYSTGPDKSFCSAVKSLQTASTSWPP